MSTLPMLHLLGLGVWIGVGGAAFAIEFYGMSDEKSLRAAAELHYTTDLWVEIPAFTTMLVTGILMLPDAQLNGLFLTKLVFALLAIFFNCVCVYKVFKRRASLRSNVSRGVLARGLSRNHVRIRVGASEPYNKPLQRTCSRLAVSG